MYPGAWEAPSLAAAMPNGDAPSPVGSGSSMCSPGRHGSSRSVLGVLRAFEVRDRENADSLGCPYQRPLLLQEQRRAERAEQQRIRSEREKERQARMAVSLPPGLGGLGWSWLVQAHPWSTWEHELCVACKPAHEVSVHPLLTLF